MPTLSRLPEKRSSVRYPTVVSPTRSGVLVWWRLRTAAGRAATPAGGLGSRLLALDRRGGLGVGDVTTAVAPHPDVRLFCMAGEAFHDAKPRAGLANGSRGLVGENALVGAGLEKLADPEAARIAGRALRRQRVIGADHLVAVGDRGARTDEK